MVISTTSGTIEIEPGYYVASGATIDELTAFKAWKDLSADEIDKLVMVMRSARYMGQLVDRIASGEQDRKGGCAVLMA